MSDSTIAAIAAGNPNFSILVRALQTADLVDAVGDGNADLTVFAPTNAAFVDLATSLGFEGDADDEDAVYGAILSAFTSLSADGDPVPLLASALTYHVSVGGKSLDALVSADSIGTLEGTGLIATGTGLLDNDPDSVDPAFIDGLTDIEASNGIIHAIDKVLRPIDFPEPTPLLTIADLASSVTGSDGFDDNPGDFDILLSALGTANLLDAVSDPSADLTVFAPTDGAFLSLAQTLGGTPASEQGTLDFIVSALTDLSPDGNPVPLLTDVLTYHVLDESLSRVELLDTPVNALFEGGNPEPGGRTIADADPGVADASFLDAATDLAAANGIVHAIDRVLLPFDLAEARSSGGDGDDRIEFNGVATDVDGGGGTDTLVFSTSRADLGVAPGAGGFQITTGGSTVGVTGIETFEFSDGSVTVDTSAEAASVARLYEAGLGRDADVGGLSFWTGVTREAGLDAVANEFIDSAEFASLFGPDPSHATYVNGLYNNVLDRDADAEGLAFWTGAFDSGSLDEADLLVLFSESPENVSRTLDATDDGLLVFA